MTTLTIEQQLFLEQQNISLSRVFNADGMSKSQYQQAMSELEMVVAYGVTPCAKAEHTLRTRGGHCAQCNTAALAFVKRFDERGEVYVAHSAEAGLTKIGVAKAHQERMRTLNSHGYGGATDWRVCFCSESNSAGRVEFMAHQTLNEYRITRPYFRTGKMINCQELFACHVAIAVDAVKRQLEGKGL